MGITKTFFFDTITKGTFENPNEFPPDDEDHDEQDERS